jgi:glycogen phosphorylase
MENAENRKSASFVKTEYEPTRTGLSPDTLARALRDNLYYTQGRMPEVATPHDWYAALACTVRDRLLQRWIKTVQTLIRQDIRVVSYLSAEFLMGPHLGNALINLGPVRQWPSWGSI